MLSDETCTAGARWGELFTQRYWAATVTLCLGVALFAFNAFLVSTALPTAVREIGGVAVIAWATSIYLALSIVGGAAASRLKARYGARAALIASAVLFLGGTLLAATASSMTEVLIGRALQGIGEGIISALCYTLIPELFPGRLIAKVFGAEAVVWATAAFGGPLLAGLVTETISWRAAFLINVPVIAIFIALVLVVVPRASADPARAPMPILRLAAIGAGIMLVTFSAIATSPAAMAALVLLAGAVLVGTIVHDRSSASPLFPSDALSPRTRVGVGLWIVFLMPLAQASTAVYLVLTLQTLWGLGATVAGAFNASLALAWSFTAIVVANLSPTQTAQPSLPPDRSCSLPALRRSSPASSAIKRWSRSPARSPSAPASGLPGPSSARPSWKTHAQASATGRRARCRRCSRPAMPSARPWPGSSPTLPAIRSLTRMR